MSPEVMQTLIYVAVAIAGYFLRHAGVPLPGVPVNPTPVAPVQPAPLDLSQLLDLMRQLLAAVPQQAPPPPKP